MQPIKIPIYLTEQIKAFERLAEERFCLSPELLMQRAGKAAFEFLHRRWPQALEIAIFCGSGNNGGDGYVLAQTAYEHGLMVHLWQLGHPNETKKAANAALEICKKSGIPLTHLTAKSDIGHPDVIVDAMCGIGLREMLREEFLIAIKKIENAYSPIFSIDVPSGIESDTGTVLGKAVSAHATITFIGYKLGLLTGSGPAYTGELIYHDLQLPSDLFTNVVPCAEKMRLNTYAPYLKPRRKDWHKGLSGHVLIIGGELGFSGAPRMAAEAALRVGAGLVSVVTRPENTQTMNIFHPEIMCHGVRTVKELIPLLQKADVIVLGTGLGQSAWSKMLWEAVAALQIPLLIDADALNLLALKPLARSNWVLTPHPGEAARLLNISVLEVQQNRLAAIHEINKRYGGVCVLKGVGSIVSTANVVPGVCDRGNPGMASAGMGDVLSGVIGGFLSQGVPAIAAAKLGVCLHAMAGDLAAKEGERGTLATDLMPYLRRLANYPNL